MPAPSPEAWPASAQEAAQWFVAGWQPSTANMQKRSPAELKAYGMEYVEVTPGPSWGMILGMLALAVVVLLVLTDGE